MSTNNSIVVDYSLQPPSDVQTPSGASPSKQHAFPVTSSSSNDNSAQAFDYYSALRSSISEAKSLIGAKLTVWRDAVGDKEKEVKKKRGAEEEDDEEEEEVQL